MTRRRMAIALGVLGAALWLGIAGAAAASPSTAQSALNGRSNDDCFRCHGRQNMRSRTINVDGEQKSLFVDRTVYDASRHGKLDCTSCHIGFKPGLHGAGETQAWLVTAKLTACANCHADVFSMYQSSFHGNLVFAESSGQAPVCADCHVAHNITPPDSPAFRASIDSLCARCHADQLKTYLDSYHGKAFYLGDVKTAVCTDCHGGHKILAPSNTQSKVSKQNLVATCAQCHPGANENFAGFMVHVNPQSPRSSFVVWTFYALYIMLIAVVFTFGFVHTALYIYRGFKDGLYRRSHHG
ncbi:MAG TPA: cytochrome c3 family protein [Thermoleophilia bacterium]